MFVLMSAGQVMTTIAIAVTVTLKEQMLVPHRFVAVQVTVVAPGLNVLPLAGVQPASVPPLTVGA
jgi:hypothetical protein